MNVSASVSMPAPSESTLPAPVVGASTVAPSPWLTAMTLWVAPPVMVSATLPAARKSLKAPPVSVSAAPPPIKAACAPVALSTCAPAVPASNTESMVPPLSVSAPVPPWTRLTLELLAVPVSAAEPVSDRYCTLAGSV